MAIAGSVASHRRRLTWAVETARIGIVVAVIAQIVLTTVPNGMIVGGGGAMPFGGWGFRLVQALSIVSSIALVVVSAALPLLALWVMPAPPVWMRWLAGAMAAIIALILLQALPVLIPGGPDWITSLWLAGVGLPAWVRVLIFVPFILSIWIGVLALIGTLAARAESRGVALATALPTLVILALTLLAATGESAPEGKALVLVFAGLWLWLSIARPEVISRGAQPWLIGLIAVWLVPDILALIPRLAAAMQVGDSAMRWGQVARILGSIETGAGLSGPILTLMIVLALVHLALETGRPSGLAILCAAAISLGLILPEIAWQRGLGSGFGAMIGMARSGAMPMGPALFGAVAALSWFAAQIAIFVAAVHLIRLPVREAVPA